jgi:DNA-binding NarL/FixJ family response regulator
MGLRVIIADGQRLTLHGMQAALEHCAGIDVVDSVSSSSDLLASLKRVDAHVALMDSELPGMEGLKLLELLRQNYASLKVGVLFSDRDMDRIHAALGAGAAACVMKDVDPADLPAAIRQVLEATVYTAAFSAMAAVHEPPHQLEDLTEREMTMLKAIAQGLSNKAISKEHWVTEQTVKFHLNNVYRKLGVPNRTAAARLAYEHGLLDQHAVA